MGELLQQLNSEIASVVEEAGRSLVQVRSVRRGHGSGILCHPEGLIITNAHVIGNAAVEVVLADGRELSAKVLAEDSDLDLAALYVEANDLPAAKFGESRNLKPGHLVLALGHPWGVSGATTAGVIIGLGSDGQSHSRSKKEWLEVNLPLRPGNSGGPLIDVYGHVVGINTMVTGPNIGIAVPIHVVKAFLHQKLGAKEPVLV